MAKAKKPASGTKASAKVKEAVAQKNAAAESKPFSNQPGPETADSNDSFSDLAPTRKRHWAVIPLALIGLVIVVFAGFGVAFGGKIYPGISVNGVAVGGMKPDQAKAAVSKATQTYQQNQVPIQYGNTTLTVDMSQIGLTYNVDAAVSDAVNHGRVGGWDDRLWQMARAII